MPMHEYATAQEVAKKLRVDRRRVYELFDRKPEHGGIRSFRIGNSRRAKWTDVETWIDQQYGETADDRR